GMSDRVSLGGRGRLKTSPRIVLRATLSPDPHKPSLNEYWVGRTFDTFNGTDWSTTTASHPPSDQVTLGHGGGRMVLQRIELLPSYGARTLVALDTPVRYANGVLH